MKIVLAPQSFKGSLSAREVAEAMAQGIRRVLPDAEIVLLPIADGGEGTVETLVYVTRGRMMRAKVTGPLGEPVDAFWGILGDKATAVIEMAAASGLPLVPRDKLNPCIATTYGTGELIRAALDAGCRKFLIGIGGSATNDGGAGMAQALGARLLNNKGKELPRGGEALADLDRIDVSGLDRRLEECEVVVACDVTNPICGKQGASWIYGPQKGATEAMCQLLDASLANYARVIKKDIGVDVMSIPGGGAAGGLGAGLIAFLKAKLARGIDIVSDMVRLTEHLRGAALVFSGEGRIDAQTSFGKTVAGVAVRAKALNIPVVVIAGEVAGDTTTFARAGINAALSIAPGPISLEKAMANAAALTADATERAMNPVPETEVSETIGNIRGRFAQMAMYKVEDKEFKELRQKIAEHVYGKAL